MIKHPLLVPVILNMNDAYWLPYCLESTRDYFSRYVIYDVNSTDESKDIISWFINSTSYVDFFYRSFDRFVPPAIQGIFRNSMALEARSEYYLILDSDEVYHSDDFPKIIEETKQLYERERYNHDDHSFQKIYGIVPRVEVTKDLNEAYGLDRKVSHHRVYHRTAIFTGPHPGEAPYYKQKKSNEVWFPNITCWHLHNTERSPKDAEVPKRLERRNRKTYSPGEKQPINLLEELPILRNPIHNFEPNPELKKKQELWHALETGAYI